MLLLNFQLILTTAKDNDHEDVLNVIPTSLEKNRSKIIIDEINDALGRPERDENISR